MMGPGWHERQQAKCRSRTCWGLFDNLIAAQIRSMALAATDERCCLHSTEYPPRPRGWTRGAAGGREAAAVSPASAGMDPHFEACRGERRCIPRVRGDGPPFGIANIESCWYPPRPRGWTRAECE